MEANLRTWQQESRREPTIRVGVILEADGYESAEFVLPPSEHEVIGEHGPPAVHRAERIVASLIGGAVALRIGQGAERVSRTWRIAPAAPEPPQRASGVEVRNVIAGRGFHWQKTCSQMLSGRLELLAGRDGLILVNVVPLEHYLAGVITAEMSGGCPPEFLKAQCVAARSWLLAFTEPKHADEPFDRCNDDCCQRYQGTGDLSTEANEAVRETRGLVLVDSAGGVVDANYAKCCGGISELPEHVWGTSKPGFTAIADTPPNSPARRFLPVTRRNLSDYILGEWQRETDIYCSPNVVPQEQLGAYLGRVDEVEDYFRWTVRSSREELEDVLKRKVPEADDLARVWDARVLARGVSGRARLVEIDIENASGSRRRVQIESEYRIREALHSRFLYSSAFLIEIERDARGLPQTVTLRGAGWGHGCGLCQIGALGMALQNMPYDAILDHYFPQARLRRVYE